MDIIGNGVDIVENKRIKNSLKIKGFVNRVFTQNEIYKSKNLNNKTNYFAKRFAAKEAFVKALGEGFRNNINFKDIDITKDKKGRPFINISNNIKKFLKKKLKLNKYKIFLSLSDEKKHSIAYVIINKKND
ncbi:MAG TPA: holo-ACP synthase [Candidatus Pelagibacter bacterium]|jgi:holo-[acyl-carrier protein] synthase|nr:holo-ACP synthase [Candidatus Pelagibacter bacterium]